MDQSVVSWIQADNQIKEYTEIIKKLRNKRDEIGNEMVVNINKDEGLKNNLPTYNITHLNSTLAFQKSNTYENYTNKFYLECFTEFLDSEEKAKELIEFMKKKRKVQSKITLKRGYLMD
tara:strand:- start:53 stop:409 length:357 start_codon:yes stop_codon:yes gene_type:complete